MPMMSSGRLRRDFRRDGYVIVRGVWSPAEAGQLRAAIEQAPPEDGENPLSSGGMRFQSNVFRRSEAVRRVICSDRVAALLAPLGLPDAWVRWDQAVWKSDGAPEFPWHQDNGYTALPTAHLQFWVALSSMDRNNGGLVVAPQQHRRMQEHTWRDNYVTLPAPRRTRSINAAPGDVVIFSSFLPHATTPNRAGADRLAYVAEYLSLEEPDWSVERPHVVAFRGGRSALEIVDLAQSWSSP